jgi:peptidoglycan/xylan/chitin deacetylase (PgdA/CDA1 family)
MSALLDRAGADPDWAAAPASSRPRKAFAVGRRCAEVLLGLLYLAGWSAANRIACLLGGGRSRLVIFYYHAVPAAQRARFARQLDSILAGADAVVTADFCTTVPPGRLLVAITFDDAYASVLDNALPELAARAMPATIFIPAGMLGKSPCWQMEAGDPDRLETVATGDRLRRLPPELITLGAHSVTHPRLPDIDRAAARAEIDGSKAALAQLLGREITTFSFPYGAYDDGVVDLCRSAAFRFAYHISPRMLDPADPSFLRGRTRVDLAGWDLEFWLKLRGADSWKSGPRKLLAWLRRRCER